MSASDDELAELAQLRRENARYQLRDEVRAEVLRALETAAESIEHLTVAVAVLKREVEILEDTLHDEVRRLREDMQRLNDRVVEQGRLLAEKSGGYDQALAGKKDGASGALVAVWAVVKKAIGLG